MDVRDATEGAMEEDSNGKDVLVFPVVNQAPRHETTRSSAGALSLILTTSHYMDIYRSFSPRPLHPRAKGFR